MELFKDKTAVVTGGASGIGRSICKELCPRGVNVIAADINIEGTQETASRKENSKQTRHFAVLYSANPG